MGRPTSDYLRKLAALSRRYGADTDFIIGGGGNTSVKTDRLLYVKASGSELGRVTPDDFVAMDRRKLGRVWKKQYHSDPFRRQTEVLRDLLDARAEATPRRPSVEVLIHACMPQRYVLHTHPTVINGLACSVEGARAVKRILGDRVVWIPYIDPGYPLALHIKNEIERARGHGKPSPRAFILANHGLFTGGNTPEQVRKVTDDIVREVKKHIQRKPDFSPCAPDRAFVTPAAPMLRMLLREPGQNSIVTFALNRELALRLDNSRAFSPVSSAFSPDHIVFCGPAPLFVGYTRDIESQMRRIQRGVHAYASRYGVNPVIVAVERRGLFAAGHTKKIADLALAAFADTLTIAAYSESFGGPRFMEQKQIDFIAGFEAESYRKKIMEGATGGIVTGKTALVTGGAQGFGRGLAEALLREGAHVIIADLNGEGACATAASFCGRYGQARASGLGVDVSDGKSVRALFDSVLASHGGIDVLVNNAGILRAGGLAETDPATFDLVTRVNYNAYFLCVKYAAESMRVQHRFDPSWQGDIIQINSKSGLEGSRKNFAYAGGKFGGIGLTQSFALELVDDNIKVNAVCPGNFFDGPLWSDPRSGLFAQYLRAGKVPGARTVADVKRFYESKVPMGRGCTVDDVARALFYLIEQKYETGQALPVTGGQVMLH